MVAACFLSIKFARSACRLRLAGSLLCLLPLTCLQAANSPAADVEACLSCHGSGGSELAPILQGQDAAYLRAQISRFRDHARQSFPMDALTQGLTDDTIAQLSEALSKQAWPEPPRLTTQPAASPSPRIETAGCTECHGQGLRGQPAIPRLAGQRSAYLVQQLEAISEGRRQHPAMPDQTADWNSAKIRALANEIQSH